MAVVCPGPQHRQDPHLWSDPLTPWPSKTSVTLPATPEAGLSISPEPRKALYKISFSTVSLGSLDKDMQKSQSHRLVWLILIPPVFAICLCVILLSPPILRFFDSSAFPDYLWSHRITRVLNDNGFSIYDKTNVSRSEPPLVAVVAVGVNSLVKGEQLEPYELVKEIHSVIMESYVNALPQPQPVDIIFVVVHRDAFDSYAVEVDFEDVQNFRAGEISEQAYFERWTLHPDTLKITPRE